MELIILNLFFNNLEFLSLHPISVSFVFKIIYFLKENQYYKLSAIIRKIYRNDNLIKSLMTHKNANNYKEYKFIDINIYIE